VVEVGGKLVGWAQAIISALAADARPTAGSRRRGKKEKKVNKAKQIRGNILLKGSWRRA